MRKRKGLQIRRFSWLLPALILASLTGILTYGIFFKIGTFWWDEATYLLLAKNFCYKHIFETNPITSTVHQEAFRPPFYPILICLFSKATFGYRYINAYALNFIEYLLTGIVLFLICKKLWDEKTGIFASILFYANPLSIKWFPMALAEATEAFISSLLLLSFIYSFEKGRQGKIASFFLPILSALAFLTKYFLGLEGIFFLIFLFYIFKERCKEKEKLNWAFSGVIVSFLILIPWFVHSYRDYGSIFGTLKYNIYLVNVYGVLHHGGVKPWQYYFQNIWDVFNISLLALIPAFYCYLKSRKGSKEFYFYTASFLYLVLFLISMSFFIKIKTTRYLVAILPILALLIAKGFDLAGNKNRVLRLLVLLYLAHLFMNFATLPKYTVWQKEGRQNLLVAAKVINMGKNVPGNIMSMEYPLFNLLTGRYVIWYPENESKMLEMIKRYNVSFVVYDSYVNDPPWALDYLNTHKNIFKLILENKTKQGIVAVYLVNRTALERN